MPSYASARQVGLLHPVDSNAQGYPATLMATISALDGLTAFGFQDIWGGQGTVASTNGDSDFGSCYTESNR